MSTDTETLERIRRDIDRIDDRIHDLLMERAALVEKVALAKAGDATVPLRPGREAEIIRRLAARHSGRFPLAAVVRIWREIIGALIGLQRPFSVAVCQPERGDGFLELARDHFGVVWGKQVFPSPGHVVRAVADNLASVGLVPLPGDSEAEPWWLSLTAGSDNLPQVVTRLPMLPLPPAPGRSDSVEGFVIACRPHDDTGADRTLVAVETVPDLSRDRLRALFIAAGLESGAVLSTHREEDRWIHLCEMESYVTADDPRLAALLGGGKDPVRHARVIGGYPLPLAPQA
ncbi:chorismate mutase [Magnetospirillum sp. 64-120]|uniref:chorismate mutase n=1 Tax=Magnetospirillum sp. 64-120 TaxID=1895778 RepID=UPI00092C4994|nr:chorismate mutase [Magnetospirillum sp. 64-120]OJX70329.1 MAG: chorismate mutase [Magnetospirillum sp. 64-120]